jgi:hypothetical protein
MDVPGRTLGGTMHRFGSGRRGSAVALLTVVLAGFGVGCTDKSQRDGGIVAETQKNGIDEQLANRVPVVLRVRFEKALGGQKYAWDEVSVLKTLKNGSNRTFSGTLQIAHYDWEPGLPQGESTVYLEPYAEGDESRWKLLGGSAKEGISHLGEMK